MTYVCVGSDAVAVRGVGGCGGGGRGRGEGGGEAKEDEAGVNGSRGIMSVQRNGTCHRKGACRPITLKAPARSPSPALPCSQQAGRALAPEQPRPEARGTHWWRALLRAGRAEECDGLGAARGNGAAEVDARFATRALRRVSLGRAVVHPDRGKRRAGESGASRIKDRNASFRLLPVTSNEVSNA